MPDAMVTARMPQVKKDAGAKVLERLGVSASSAINQLYDYLIENGALPFNAQRKTKLASKDQLAEALSFVDAIPQVAPDGFELLDHHEIKRRKLIGKGHAAKGDLA